MRRGWGTSVETPRRSADSGGVLSSIEGTKTPVLAKRVKEWGFVVLLMVIALIVRLDFMRAGEFVIDADEAIVGLMGKHIVEGRGIPTFYYGQHYMGSLEAILASVVFRIFGVSGFALQLVPLSFSLALVYVMYRLGKAVGGVSVGRVAALLCAIPPSPLVVWSFKARGGFIELIVIGALALLLTVRWLRKPSTNLSYPALIWLCLGLGWWVNNQIIYFLVPIGIFGALKSFSSLRAQRMSMSQAVSLACVATTSFFIGSAPYWIYNLRKGFPSLGMFGFASSSDIAEHVAGLFRSALPIILGAKHFWQDNPVFPGSTWAVCGLYLAVFLWVLWARRRTIASLLRCSVDRIEPLEIFLLFIPFTCAVFAVSSFGWLWQAPRYLLPLYVGVFVVSGWFVREMLRRSATLGAVVLVAMVGLNIASSYAGGRAIPGEPVVFNGERVSRDHSEVIHTLDTLGITKVRTNYWIGYRLAFETNERVTFLVFEAPKQIRIDEYENLVDPHERFVFPLLLVPSERARYGPGLTRLGYTYKETFVNGYYLIYDIKLADSLGEEIPDAMIKSVQAWGTNPPGAAVDGDLNTRWGTGAHQQPGQSFGFTLKEPVVMSGFRYNLGGWSVDYPRGLRVDVTDEFGAVVTVLTPDEFQTLMPLSESDEFRIPIKPTKVRSVTFTQTGTHPILDWSIAELSLFQSPARNKSEKR
jgi:hypothetical protein